MGCWLLIPRWQQDMGEILPHYYAVVGVFSISVRKMVKPLLYADLPPLTPSASADKL
jgi:hypothetical protein